MESQRKGDCRLRAAATGYVHYNWEMYTLPFNNLESWIFQKAMKKGHRAFIGACF